MMNFPTWPCEYPSARIEDKPVKKVKAKKVSKKISSLQEQPIVYIEDMDHQQKGDFLKSFDDYINNLLLNSNQMKFDIDTNGITVNINKLAEGSYVVKSDAFINGLSDGFIGGFDLDDSYSKDGQIPFPKIPSVDYYTHPTDLQDIVDKWEQIASNWSDTPKDEPF
jgi:hypothetical protein